MKKLIYIIIAIVTLSSCCYEYQKIPNVKRVKRKDVKRAMKYSSWQYSNVNKSKYKPKKQN